MSLLGAGEIRELAAKLDLKPSKSLGQNFVHDANVCRKIVRTAGVTSSDIALEIGPGLGSLTLAMLEEAQSVIAVEIEARLANQFFETYNRDCLVLDKSLVSLLLRYANQSL